MNLLEKNIWPEGLITFLRVIKDSELNRSVLDCGAGGKKPPLALFHRIGFKTYGIDISDQSLQFASSYEQKNNIKLNIKYGDMRNLPFEDSTISFVFTQNSLCHLDKRDHAVVIDEIVRVLRPEGYCFIDFMSTESSYCNEEEMRLYTLVGDNEYRKKGQDVDCYHSFFNDEEPDKYFSQLNIVRIDKIVSDIRAKHSWVDVRYNYYAQKVL